MDTGACLDDNVFLGLSVGGLAPDVEAQARAHLEGCPRCRELYDYVARIESQHGGTPLSSLPLKFRPGDVIADKYRLTGHLGSGGMASVMAATHITLDRAVAIKFLTDRDPNSRVRFEREARALVKLKSPYIVSVIDVDKLPDGSPFMVMELLRGRDLGEHLEERKGLPVDEALRYVRELCLGLEAVHAAGIVHRDLKPQNIYLSEENDGTRVRLIDFGLAKTTFTEELTRTREFLGTPYYMAPEQIEDARLADTRSDVWGVGACLYLMLTGENPFEGTSLPAICRKVLHEDPPSVEQLRADLPPGLGAIVRRCLRKVPNDRYPSIHALALELRQLIPVKERRVWPYVAGVAAAIVVLFFLFRGKSAPDPSNRVAPPAFVVTTEPSPIAPAVPSPSVATPSPVATPLPVAPPSPVATTDELPSVTSPPARPHRAPSRALAPGKPTSSGPRLYDKY